MWHCVALLPCGGLQPCGANGLRGIEPTITANIGKASCHSSAYFCMGRQAFPKKNYGLKTVHLLHKRQALLTHKFIYFQFCFTRTIPLVLVSQPLEKQTSAHSLARTRDTPLKRVPRDPFGAKFVHFSVHTVTEGLTWVNMGQTGVHVGPCGSKWHQNGL